MIRETILQKLDELEQAENIKILYACESGSRAWGFASADSDFDVRFIYTKRLNEYLSITESTDVLGLPVDDILDISGWDLKKSLKLFLKSNAPLYEWLQSPIIYRQDEVFTREMHHLMPAYFSPRSAANHYFSMAINTMRDDLQGSQVKLKRYFYALRPALACLWIITKQTVPPMEFAPLRTLITAVDIRQEIDDLLGQKKHANEKAVIKPVSLLNNWIETLLDQCSKGLADLPAVREDPSELDKIFRKYLLP